MRPLRHISFWVLFVYLSLGACAYASESNGTITAGSHLTRVCKDTTCTTPAPGIINFRPTGTTAVTIEDTAGIDGIAWGSEIGWITFDPTGPEGVTINPANGEISGKAWAQGAGWINFRPANSGTSALGLSIGVSINANGEFVGWAWTGGPHGGWMKFDCASASTCIKTDWRPTSARSTTPPAPTPTPAPSTNGSPSGGADLCANIFGTQVTVPVGYTFDGGVCIEIPKDACDNLPGFQAGVPQGYVRDDAGMCVLPIDFCSNIVGLQQQIPLGMVVRTDGTCGAPEPFQVDVDNDGIVDIPGTGISSTGSISGLPTIFNPNTQSVPDFLKPYTERFADYCPNLEGFQASIPLGFVTDTVGWCVPAYLDYCPNIPGEQPMIPSDLFIDESGACVITDERAYLHPVEEGKKIISLSFVPPDVRVPLNWGLAASVLDGIADFTPQSVDTPALASTGTPDYPVDFVSVLLLADMLFVITLAVFILARKVFRLL